MEKNNSIKKETKYEMHFRYIAPLLFILSCMIFAAPSILYYFKNHTILHFPYEFQFLLNDSNRISQGLIYFIMLLLIVILYSLIIKRSKQIFSNIKKVFLFIAIISVIFLIIVPINSSDVFYYLGIGRIDGAYGQNPYYTTMKDFVETGDNVQLLQEDTVLLQGYENFWSYTTVIYGPIWTFICKIVGFLSFGNIDVGLLIFKLFNLIIHLLNCLLIYKITRRKLFTLLYGLNPFILVEGIAAVHNDIYMIFFILLSLYVLLKKDNIILSTAILAIATAIKYFSIILLPFIIIYYFRKEKPLKRFIKCIQYGTWFVFVIILCYSFYIRDFQVLQGIFTVQNKTTKNFYVILRNYFGNIPNLVDMVKATLLIFFTVFYTGICIYLIRKKNFKFSKLMRTANGLLVAFLFLLVTNFQPWYIMWLFPCLMWQKAKNIKAIIVTSHISQLTNTIFFMFTEDCLIGIPYTFIFITSSLLYVIFQQNKCRGSRKDNGNTNMKAQ